MIRRLPKADIHVHLPGTISPEIAWDLGVRNGLLQWKCGAWQGMRLSGHNPHKYYSDIFKNFDQVCYQQYPQKDLLYYNITYRDFSSFDQVMATIQGHRFPPGGIQNEQDLFFVLEAYLQQCLDAHITYTEVQQNIRIAYTLYPKSSQEEARFHLFSLFARAIDLYAAHGVTLRFINCFNKTNSAGLSSTTRQRAHDAALWLEEADRLFPGVFVGLQSAGSESCVGSQPGKLKDGYMYAYERGFGCEAHAGEGIGYQYLQETLDLLPVQRIAHGFQAIEHLPTIHDIQDREVTLVMAPLINLFLGAQIYHYSEGRKIGKTIIEHVDQHPLFVLLREHKLRIALSSDNPQMGGVPLLDTMMLLAGFLPNKMKYSPAFCSVKEPLTTREVVYLIAQAMISSFAPVSVKIAFLSALIDEGEMLIPGDEAISI